MYRYREIGKKEYAERNAQRSTDAPLSLTAHVPSPFGKARFMNPCRFLKGRDALAAPFPSSPNTREGAQRGGKRELPEHHLHASTCGPSSRERVGQRTRTPATEHNDQEAHATVTGRKGKMRRPKSPHLPPKPTRQHCAPQPMLEVSQCRFGPKR